MVNVNPPEKKHGLIVLENEVGHQQWALIVDAEVEYDNDVSISSSDAAQYSVTTTLAPGEMLRMASTFNPNEENVLVYSRLLVSVLREERERYAALEKRATRAEAERDEWRQTALDERGAALDALEQIKARDARIKAVQDLIDQADTAGDWTVTCTRLQSAIDNPNPYEETP